MQCSISYYFKSHLFITRCLSTLPQQVLSRHDRLWGLFGWLVLIFKESTPHMSQCMCKEDLWIDDNVKQRTKPIERSSTSSTSLTLQLMKNDFDEKLINETWRFCSFLLLWILSDLKFGYVISLCVVEHVQIIKSIKSKNHCMLYYKVRSFDLEIFVRKN